MNIPGASKPFRPLWTIAAIATLAFVAYQYYQSWVSAHAKPPRIAVAPAEQRRSNAAPVMSMAQWQAEHGGTGPAGGANQTGARLTPETGHSWEKQISGRVQAPTFVPAPSDGSPGTTPSPSPDHSGAKNVAPN